MIVEDSIGARRDEVPGAGEPAHGPRWGVVWPAIGKNDDVIDARGSGKTSSDALLPDWPEHVDPTEWPEFSYRFDLTDGLPTFPPERHRVDALVAASQRDGDEVIGPIPPTGRSATITAIAANAAMAGLQPHLMPVVITALEAMLEPRFNLSGLVVTTHPAWPLVIVSGAAVSDGGFATGESLFSGGGARANLAVGRTIRLVTWNIGGARPRHPVQEVLGQPGRLAYCIAEEPVATPWPALHEARGVDAPHGAVTVFGCDAPHSVIAVGTAERAELMLEQVAEQIRAAGNSNTHTMGETLVVMAPQWARLLARQGWTRAMVQDELHQRAARRLGDIKRRGDGTPAIGHDDRYPWWPESIDQSNPDELVASTWGPESIHVVVAGGDSVTFAAVCPGWGTYGGFAVTRPLPVAVAPAGTAKERP